MDLFISVKCYCFNIIFRRRKPMTILPLNLRIDEGIFLSDNIFYLQEAVFVLHFVDGKSPEIKHFKSNL